MRHGALVLCCLIGLGVWCGAAAAESSGWAVLGGGQIVPLYGDSGCISIQCSRLCLYNSANYLCSTRATFSRYDDQMQGLPLRVTAIADCMVVTPFGERTCFKSWSVTGTGQATALATCYVQTIWAGPNWNEGECLCQEL